MKKILRALIYTSLSLEAARQVIGAFDYGNDSFKTVTLLVLGLSLLFFFLKPLISIVSLPTKGIPFVFLTFAMSVIVLYVSTLFVPGFSIHSSTVSGLNILGFSFPSYDLTSFQAMICSALIVSLTYSFLEWLGSKR
ncbi:hypothetical protein ACFLZ4_01075 [Patescibacteria group bacterium]